MNYNNNINMEKTTLFNVTEETAAYISALHAIENAANMYLTALDLELGEQQGDAFFQNYAADLFEKIREDIGKNMARCILTQPRHEKPNTI